MSDHFLQLTVDYEDLPDLIELRVRVSHGGWSADSTAYVSPIFLCESGKSILEWVESPQHPLRIEAGANTGIGWLVLHFYTIDSAGHVRCAVELATKTRTDGPRPAETRRFAIEVPTELGLVERFGRECLSLGNDFKREARLITLPPSVLVASSHEGTVKEYRVTKYDPALRGANGEYEGDDWVMFKQIGQTSRGVVLTEQEYKRVENAYVKVALAFLSESGIAALRVVGLENTRRQALEFKEGSVLPLEKLSEVFGRILREEFWCRFQGDDSFVHFGWDYYMYIGVPRPCPSAEQAALELGLYVEECTSPYHEETENQSGPLR